VLEESHEERKVDAEKAAVAGASMLTELENVYSLVSLMVMLSQ